MLAQRRIPIIVCESADANPYIILSLDMVALCPGEGPTHSQPATKERDGRQESV